MTALQAAAAPCHLNPEDGKVDNEVEEGRTMKEPWLTILMPSMVLGSLFALAIGLRLLARDLTRRTGVHFNSRFALLNGYRLVWLAMIAYPVLALRWLLQPSKRGMSLDWGEETTAGEEKTIIGQSTRHDHSTIGRR